MNADLLRRVEEVFAEALAQPRDSRTLWLESRCAGDAELLREVESLLESHEDEDDAFLDPKELQNQVRPLELPTLERKSRLGDYTILDVLGVGGMGVVYLAQQLRPRRTVALKVLSAIVVTPSLVKRFEHEAEILGRLQHPGIAQIYEAGVAGTADGRRAQPFIAMELVDGPPMTKFATEKSLDARERVRLMIKICDAVHHAHQRGVIHRDLKPANILVDPAGQPKVLDFGVARAADTDLERTAQRTAHRTGEGQLVGTLSYMSPEQVSGDPDLIDTRTDVYSLGVLLYELLAGTLPIDIKGRSIPDAVRAIAENDRTRLPSVPGDARGDLEVVAAKALERDKSRRYQSAAQLGEDLRRWLEGQPISAKQDSALYVLLTQARRHRKVVWTAAAALMMIVGFAFFAAIQANLQAKARQAAEIALSESEVQRKRADFAISQYRRELSSSTIERGRLLAAGGNLRAGEELVWNEFLREPKNRQAHWALRDAYSRQPCLVTKTLHSQTIRSVAAPAGADLFFSTSHDGDLAVWTSPDLHEVARVRAHETKTLNVRVSDDARAIVTSGEDGTIKLWSGPSPVFVRTLAAKSGPVYGLSLSPDGKTVAWVFNSILEVENIDTGATLFRMQFRAFPGQVAALSPDRPVVAVGSVQGGIRLINYLTGEELFDLPRHTASVNDMRFSRDGALLASSSSDRTAKLFDARSGVELATLKASNGNLGWLSFNADGSLLATAGWWRVDLWDTRTGQRVMADNGRVETATAMTFDATGRYILAVPSEGIGRVWEVGSLGYVLDVPAHGAGVRAVVASADRTRVYTAAADGEVACWDARSWKRIWKSRVVNPAQPRSMDIAPNGSVLAVAGTVGASFLDANSGSIIGTIDDIRSQMNGVALSKSGTLAYFGGWEWGVRVWDIRRGRTVGWLSTPSGETVGVTTNPDRTRLITTNRTRTLQVWDMQTHELLRETTEPERLPWRAVLSPDEKLLAAGTWQQTIEIYDAKTMRRLLSVPGSSMLVQMVAFDPTSSVIAAASAGGEVRVLDASSGQTLAVLARGPLQANCVEFLDERLLMVGFESGDVRVWDLDYYDRHIAGNLPARLEAGERAAQVASAEPRASSGVEPSMANVENAPEARAWVARWTGEIMQRPWPVLPASVPIEDRVTTNQPAPR
jgi:eukaryotic-like serine/threonine-protein kinase